MVNVVSGHGKSMYLQVANFICRKIVAGDWKEDSSMPAVLEISMMLEISPEITKKAIAFLLKKKVLAANKNQFIISKDALVHASEFLKESFINDEVPALAERLVLLQISIEELHQRLDTYLAQNKPLNK